MRSILATRQQKGVHRCTPIGAGVSASVSLSRRQARRHIYGQHQADREVSDIRPGALRVSQRFL